MAVLAGEVSYLDAIADYRSVFIDSLVAMEQWGFNVVNDLRSSHIPYTS